MRKGSKGLAEQRVWIGWDSREDAAYRVARDSLLRRASAPVTVRPIRLRDLTRRGVFDRPVDPLASTEFTYTRFLTPYLADYRGWALFCDCDFLFLGDVAELREFADPAVAVYCVQHDHRPAETVKMDGRAQTVYPRKNWSSFMLFNCGHPSTRRLTPETVSSAEPAYLHRMAWAGDAEIGALPADWNWIAGTSPPPPTGAGPRAVHFTAGGPWFEACQDVPYAEAWRAADALSRADPM